MPVADHYTIPSGGALYAGMFPPDPPSSLPSWLAALPLWQWYSIPNTALSSIAPSPSPPGNPKGKIEDWCGSALKRLGSIYIIVACGGHAGYTGNEANALALNVEVPGWVQLRGPTATADIWQRTPVYQDLRRSALHTYWSLQFDNANNRVLVVSSGVPFDIAGVPNAPADWTYPNSDNVLMAFDLDDNDWLHPEALARLPFGASASADLCCTDPVTGEIYYAKSQEGRLYKYAPADDEWTNVGAWYLNGGYAGSAIDHARGRLLYVGDNQGIRAPGFRSIANGAAISASFGGLGADALKNNGYPGLVFDEANDSFLMAKNGSTNIELVRVNAETLEVDIPETTGTPPTKRINSICNSFQYVPELRSVVIANSYTGNVQIMRTAA